LDERPKDCESERAKGSKREPTIGVLSVMTVVGLVGAGERAERVSGHTHSDVTGWASEASPARTNERSE